MSDPNHMMHKLFSLIILVFNHVAKSEEFIIPTEGSLCFQIWQPTLAQTTQL